MIRRPTLETLGIAGMILGAVGLAAPFVPFAWKWFWPDPVATLDTPRANTSLAGCFAVEGRAVPSTLWRRPLWLIAAQDGRGWHPLTRIDPSPGTWRHRTCVHGFTDDSNRFALVVADGERDEAFRRELVEPDDPIPEWLKPRGTMEQGGRGRRRGCGPIPDGLKLLSLVEVKVLEGDLRWPITSDYPDVPYFSRHGRLFSVPGSPAPPSADCRGMHYGRCGKRVLSLTRHGPAQRRAVPGR